MRLGDFFTSDEMACKGENCCGGSYPMDAGLIRRLDRLRMLVGQPVHVRSGFRCRTHNAEIRNASPKSQHMLGRAADIYVKDIDFDDFVKLVELVYFNGIGLYDWGVHVDVRDGDERFWDFRTGRP